jgi:hypothetical protein
VAAASTVATATGAEIANAEIGTAMPGATGIATAIESETRIASATASATSSARRTTQAHRARHAPPSKPRVRRNHRNPDKDNKPPVVVLVVVVVVVVAVAVAAAAAADARGTEGVAGNATIMASRVAPPARTAARRRPQGLLRRSTHRPRSTTSRARITRRHGRR